MFTQDAGNQQHHRDRCGDRIVDLQYGLALDQDRQGQHLATAEQCRRGERAHRKVEGHQACGHQAWHSERQHHTIHRAPRTRPEDGGSLLEALGNGLDDAEQHQHHQR